MPIMYSVISRGTTVLARHASCGGNFSEVSEQILSRISSTNEKMTYTHNNFLFHYINESGIIYLCITDDEFERSRAFLFLNEIKRRFQSAYSLTANNALAYAMNPEFSRVLENEMKHYTSSPDVDTISKVHGELDELKDIMVRNIDNIAARGERLELLVNKTESLSNNATTYRMASRNLARAMFWKNVKIYVFIAIVLIVLIYIVVAISCGGLAWQGCLNSQ